MQSRVANLLAAPLPPTDGLAVCCIGAGYVGGPTSAVLALKNPRVRVSVVDSWAERIAAWNSSTLPIYEPGLDSVVRAAKAQGNLTFSTDVDGEVRKGKSTNANAPPAHSHRRC